ncbi:MAG: tetratricopeptide repeat protein [Acidobacteriota bacterium]
MKREIQGRSKAHGTVRGECPSLRSVPVGRRSGRAVGAVVVLALVAAVAAQGQESSSTHSAFFSAPDSLPAIYGYVTDPAGKPVAQATVEVFLNSDFRTDYDITDTDGFFGILLPKRSDFWDVRIHADGYLSSSSQHLSIFKRERLDVVLRPDPRGKVGAPIEPKSRIKARKVMREGLGLAGKGEREKAIVMLREAVTIDPDYCAAHNNLGVQLRLAGDLAGAEDQLRQATTLDPIDYASHVNLGALLLDTGRPHEAAPVLEQAALADPTAPQAAALLGKAYLELGLGKQALAALQEAQKLAGAKLDLSLEISDAQVLRGDLADALAGKESWLAGHPSDPRADHVRASIAALRERLKSAT